MNWLRAKDKKGEILSANITGKSKSVEEKIMIANISKKLTDRLLLKSMIEFAILKVKSVFVCITMAEVVLSFALIYEIMKKSHKLCSTLG